MSPKDSSVFVRVGDESDHPVGLARLRHSDDGAHEWIHRDSTSAISADESEAYLGRCVIPKHARVTLSAR